MARSSVTYCPHCGQQLTISATPGAAEGLARTRGQWERPATLESAVKLHNTTNETPAPPITGNWQRITPVGRLTTQDITTSLYDAGISFGLVTVGSFVTCWWFEWPLIIAPAAGFVFGLTRYFGGLSLAKRLLQIVESTTGLDIDQDDDVGDKPAPQSHTVQVEIRDRTDNKNRWQFHEFNIEPYKLHDLATLVLNGASFSERTAKAPGVTQEEFGTLRDQFIDGGLAKWNHPTRKQQGVTITRSGRYILQAIADSPPPPALDSPENDATDRRQQQAARNNL